MITVNRLPAPLLLFQSMTKTLTDALFLRSVMLDYLSDCFRLLLSHQGESGRVCKKGERRRRKKEGRRERTGGGERGSAAAGIYFLGGNGEKQETAATSPRASSDTHTHTHTHTCENTPAHTHFADSAHDTHSLTHSHTHTPLLLPLFPFNLAQTQTQISSEH